MTFPTTEPQEDAIAPWKIPEKKHRQHHVWQRYLRAWCVDGQLRCLMDGRIFPTGTATLAVERDFYSIGRLTADDIALIRFLVVDVKGLHPLGRQNHEDFLNLLIAPALFEGQASEVDDFIDAFRTNALEDYHAGIESSFIPLLDSARRKDISFYSDEESSVIFFHFLATQHTRTKGIRVKTIDVLKRNVGLDVSKI